MQSCKLQTGPHDRVIRYELLYQIKTLVESQLTLIKSEVNWLQILKNTVSCFLYFFVFLLALCIIKDSYEIFQRLKNSAELILDKILIPYYGLIPLIILSIILRNILNTFIIKSNFKKLNKVKYQEGENLITSVVNFCKKIFGKHDCAESEEQKNLIFYVLENDLEHKGRSYLELHLELQNQEEIKKFRDKYKIDNPKFDSLVSTNLSRDKIREIQLKLFNLKFNPGEIDGNYNLMTVAAVIYFQAASKLEINGEVGPETLKALGIS
jgi:hypothetical protein